MKSLSFIIVLLFSLTTLFGQAPAGFNYQAVMRDPSGTIKVNTAAVVRIDLLQGSSSGTAVYSESFNTTTNNFGLITLQVGKGAVLSGTFSTIDWAGNSYFIKVSIDGAEMGISQILSVPYSLYSDRASNGFKGNFNKSINAFWLDTIQGNLAVNSSGTVKYGTGCTAIGAYSQNNNLGSENTSVGYQSLFSNKGIWNTACGAGALRDNTTGIGNAAFGVASLYKNTTGYYNNAFGLSTLASNTVGGGNSAFGRAALYSNTTGNENIALGNYSLYYNTIGNNNVVIGNCALYKSMEGNFNIAIGDSALFWSTNSNKNTAIGYRSLFMTTGMDNTAVGYHSLVANTSGFDNVAVGIFALESNKDGTGNTAVGKNAMHSMVSGSNNTAMGFNANVNGYVSNSMAIGYNAYANASNKIVLGNANATTVGGYGDWSNYSDRRLKENIVYTNKLGLNFITSLKTVSYNYVSDTNKRRRDGLIAQDVDQTLKELGIDFSALVIDDDKDKTMNLSYAEFVIPLINAVKELDKKNQVLETALKEMKAEIDRLKQSK
jgi:trimeric autotransporter adhesin